MYAISLTSIPPRFPQLRPVLQSLLAQDPAPERVILCLPRHYRRFPGAVSAPELPDGIQLIWSEVDLGPATKALPAAHLLTGTGTSLIYCDDDWLMPQNWAAELLAARDMDEAVAGSGYRVNRLGRYSDTGAGRIDIAQGFSGVLVDPGWLAALDLNPPEPAWPVDDVWLSGHLARQNISIRLAPTAREDMQLAFEDTHSLQDTVMSGKTRDQANRACAELLYQHYRIWPPVD